MSLFRRRPSPSPVLQGNRFDYDDPELELVSPPNLTDLQLHGALASTPTSDSDRRDALYREINHRRKWEAVLAAQAAVREDCACELEEL